MGESDEATLMGGGSEASVPVGALGENEAICLDSDDEGEDHGAIHGNGHITASMSESAVITESETATVATNNPLLNPAVPLHSFFTTDHIKEAGMSQSRPQPAKRPPGRAQVGSVWDGYLNPVCNGNGKIIQYKGGWKDDSSVGKDDSVEDGDVDDDDDVVDDGESAPKKPRFLRRFQPAWKDIVPWVFLVSTLAAGQLCPLDPNCVGCSKCSKMFCKLCLERNEPPCKGSEQNMFVKDGCSSFRIESCANHKKNHHKADFTQTQSPITLSFQNQAERQRSAIIGIFRNVYFLAKRNLALHNLESLCHLLKLQGVDLGRRYMNCHSARAMMMSLAHVIRQRVIISARSSPCIALAVDESTDISHTGQVKRQPTPNPYPKH